MLDVGKTSECATLTTSPKEKKKKKTPKPKKKGGKKFSPDVFLSNQL